MELIFIRLFILTGLLVFGSPISAQRIDSQALLWREIGKLADSNQITPKQAVEMFRMAFPAAGALPDGTSFEAGSGDRGLSDLLGAVPVVNLLPGGVGEVIDPLALAGDDYHLILVVREPRALSRFVGRLGKRLDQIEARSDSGWAMSWLVVDDDLKRAATICERMERTFPDSLVAGFVRSQDSIEPRRDPVAAAYIAKGGRLLQELSFESDSSSAYKRILQAVDAVMPNKPAQRVP